MTDSAGDELRMLRHRAYGTTADIHLDPAALERLRQLEDGGHTSKTSDTAAADTEPSPVGPPPPDRVEDPVLTSSQPDAPFPAPWRPQFRARRSTVLIMLATALIATVAIVALILVQRVQTDPLQVGASQVARLSIDTEFDAPDVLARGETMGMVAYRDFYGLRTVIQEQSATGSNDECMTIYQPEFLDASGGGYSYSGQLFLTACAAGVFPAAVVFEVPVDSPELLRDAYPVGTPLQFVHDRSNNEIVVFEGTSP